MRDENQRTWRKTLGAETRTNSKPNPHMTLSPEIEPGPHWWRASALNHSTPPFDVIFYPLSPN